MYRAVAKPLDHYKISNFYYFFITLYFRVGLTVLGWRIFSECRIYWLSSINMQFFYQHWVLSQSAVSHGEWRSLWYSTCCYSDQSDLLNLRALVSDPRRIHRIQSTATFSHLLRARNGRVRHCRGVKSFWELYTSDDRCCFEIEPFHANPMRSLLFVSTLKPRPFSNHQYFRSGFRIR